MTKTQTWTMTAISAIALVVGVLLATGALTSAQSATPTPAATPAASPGTFKSNEDPAHEANESAAQEAAEDSGQRPAGPGGSFKPNEDPAHEAQESAEREAQENAGLAPSATTSAEPGAGNPGQRQLRQRHRCHHAGDIRHRGDGGHGRRRRRGGRAVVLPQRRISLVQLDKSGGYRDRRLRHVREQFRYNAGALYRQ